MELERKEEWRVTEKREKNKDAEMIKFNHN